MVVTKGCWWFEGCSCLQVGCQSSCTHARQCTGERPSRCLQLNPPRTRAGAIHQALAIHQVLGSLLPQPPSHPTLLSPPRTVLRYTLVSTTLAWPPAPSAQDACDLGYLVTLVPDCCATYSQVRREGRGRRGSNRWRDCLRSRLRQGAAPPGIPVLHHARDTPHWACARLFCRMARHGAQSPPAQSFRGRFGCRNPSLPGSRNAVRLTSSLVLARLPPSPQARHDAAVSAISGYCRQRTLEQLEEELQAAAAAAKEAGRRPMQCV